MKTEAIVISKNLWKYSNESCLGTLLYKNQGANENHKAINIAYREVVMQTK